MNVLITSASRKVSLVQAFQRALAAESGGRVIAADCQPRAAALYVADGAAILPRSDAPKFWDALVRVIREHAIALLVPTRDEELPLFSERRAELEALGVTVPVAPLESVRLCQDKPRFARFCIEHGFSVPRILGEGELHSRDAFPAFARARASKSGKGAFRVASREELALRRAEHGELLVQELVDAPELSLDVLSDLQARVISVVPRVRGVVVGGESFVSRTADDPAMVALGARLAEQLALRGHCVMQVFDRRATHAGRIDVIEVNPRFGGASALAIAAGCDSPRDLVRMASGREVEPSLGRYRSGLTMLRYTQDLFVSDDDLEHDRREHRGAARRPL